MNSSKLNLYSSCFCLKSISIRSVSQS